MSQFFKKKPKKTKNVTDMKEEESNLVLKGINTAKLDKEFCMNELTKFASKKMLSISFVDETGAEEEKFEVQIDDEPVLTSEQPSKKLESYIEAVAQKPVEKEGGFFSKKQKTAKVETTVSKPPKEEKRLSNLRKITTKLETLGISNEQKPKHYETIIKSEHISVKMYSCCDEMNKAKEIPSQTDVYCWWCRHSIPEDWHPLGCPVKFVKKDNKTTFEEYFETDGIFCSFNCALAYINVEMRFNIRYRESGGLLQLLYKKLLGVDGQFSPALDWRLLKKYGGCLSISEFRSTFQEANMMTVNTQKATRGFEKTPMSPTGWVYIEETNNKKVYS